ncbi:hypothetical protein [Aquimarina macrocephali]|uniref:hypothetical protein n=1 Tax=Aquimarina macrocephali TaxID=666563 RepID=UPI003F66B481
MGKRFIDISSLPKAWRKLEPTLKLTWFYLWNNCDASGVWEIDMDLFEFENGFVFDFEALKEELPDELEKSGDLILLNQYIAINYVTLKDNYNPHKPVFRAILKNNLKLKPSLNQGYFKLEDEDEDEKEEEYEKGGVREKTEINKNFLKMTCEYFSQVGEEREMKVWSFLKSLKNQNKLQEFQKQTKAYILYKTKSEETTHGWLSYQAEWENTNWHHKLSKLGSSLKEMNNEVKEKVKQYD